jgi:nucleoside-diphosphate-sugar epimerase
MKIAITGASGFVGKNIIDSLKENYQLISLSVRYKPNQSFEFNEQVIIHLAGKAHDLKKVSKPSEYYEANFELTKQLFDSFLKSEASVFIFMSTVKAVADEVFDVLTEETSPNPKTHYGIAKQRAESYILSKNIPKEKRVYILRPCMIHGPKNKGNLNVLYQFVSKGLPWILGSFDNKRSFLSIDNLCFVINEIIEREEIPSGIYQLADNEALSTNDLIKILGTSLNKKISIWNIPTFLIKFLAKLGDVLHLPINSERLQKLTENYIVSNRKIIRAIGKELPVSAKEGLIKTFQSFN